MPEWLGKIGLLVIAAAAVTLMAAMHGVMGESLFALVRDLSPISRISAALSLFLLFAYMLWTKDHLIHRWQALLSTAHQHSPPPLPSGKLILGLILFALTAMAQGMLALSTAHGAAAWLHHDYGAMVGLGGAFFLAATLALWFLRDRLFSMEARVKTVGHGEWPFQVALVGLSTPGQGTEADFAKDKQAFADANAVFNQTLQKEGWTAALNALCGEHQAFGTLPFWNMQMPLRLLRSMAGERSVPAQERLIVFFTTLESEKRFADAEGLLLTIVQKNPSLHIRICHVRDLERLPEAFRGLESGQFQKLEFEHSFALIKAALNTLTGPMGHDPRNVVVDTTSGTKEMSIIGALATIDSKISFTYVNTNDSKVGRFDVNARGVGISE